MIAFLAYVATLSLLGQLVVIVILAFALFGMLQLPLTIGGTVRRLKRRLRLYNRTARMARR